MRQTFRIGSQIGPYDPFWVQVREAVSQRVQQLGLELIPLEITQRPDMLPVEDQISLVEELVARQLDAVICCNLSEQMIERLLDEGLPIIYLSETKIRHPLFVSPHGLYEAGRMIGALFAERLGGRGRVLCVGGLSEDIDKEDGRTRIDGFYDALSLFPDIAVTHVATCWRYEQAYPQIEAALKRLQTHTDACFGLSDSIALAARDALRALGLLGPETLIAGVNGDPLALAAMVEGSLCATVDTSPHEFGSRAVELAYQAACGEPLPDLFSYKLRLVTAENLPAVGLQKLQAIAELPTRLVGVNRHLERTRLTQMEISAAINRRVERLLDRHQLSHEIATLIRDSYGYDHVQLLIWSEERQVFLLEQGGAIPGEKIAIPLERSGMLGAALRHNEPIFIPDTRYNYRFPPDPAWPDTLARVVLPIRLDEEVLGLLDLHSRRSATHLRQELLGLEPLADQLAIAIRNAELFAEAVQARAAAERADQLKTRLLANVSHELRAPLDVILGHSQIALSQPNPYGTELPEGLRRDIGSIFRSGQHLTRLINDLLDLSRAEINQLDIFPETISTRSFLEDVFRSVADTSPGALAWRLCLPDRLPVIQADPVRLRQILLNLLGNAKKFTSDGEVELGAAVEPPYLRLWVRDTGVGIPASLQERIFEPFVTVERSGQRSEGVGLGLSITRRLVALHGGVMSLASQPGQGSTFHVALPLPNRAEDARSPSVARRPVLLVLSGRRERSQELLALAAQMGLPLLSAGAPEDLEVVLEQASPSVLAWDMRSDNRAAWELLEQIRSHPRLRQLPLIVYREESGGFEATEVLMKPVAGGTLREALSVLAPARGAGPVLIVDDEAEARDFYRRLVGEALPDSPVLCAGHGTAALELLQEATPGLVILDLMMPDMDGFTILEAIRSRPATRTTPVLIMSGKLLSAEDIRRLDYARVTFQSKGLLSYDEAVALLRDIVAPGEALPQPTSLVVKAAIVYLHQNYAQRLTRQEIADAVGISSNYLSRIFHQEVGLSAWDCLNRFRILKAQELLRRSPASIAEVAAQVGFDDPAYFSRMFRKHTGLSPQAYRQAER
ncbi:MAG TPA: substrate-binding domain-containing protein [Roseiflexaceae bacterium]|nr:substrate-binding domain-containing protein [Roseiflexaceae bacterium]